jgi:PAS domain S-box-containing protein
LDAIDNDIIQLLNGYRKAIDISFITSVTDAKGNITYVNKRFCEVSGYTEEEMLGGTFKKINSGFHDPAFFRELWNTIKSGNIWKGEIRNKTKDGNIYWVDAVILPVSFRQGTQFLSLESLITERKELESRREQYIRSLEHLVHLSSHHLRKPLVSLLGLIQLDIEKFSQAEYAKVMGYMRDPVEELDRISRDLTAYLELLKAKLDKPSAESKDINLPF